MLKLKLQYLATWCEELMHLKRPWCWERLKVGGEGDDRGWDGWMASPTQWTRVWVNSGSWWWTERPGMLQSMGLQRVGHDLVTELNWWFPSLCRNFLVWCCPTCLLLLLFCYISFGNQIQKNHNQDLTSSSLLPMFSRSFMLSSLMFMSLIHFGINFVYSL